MILKPLQLLYTFSSEVKNLLYDRQWIKQVELPIPVISVGNLSVGGTGKTPCVHFLATELEKTGRYKKICVVSRSYKGSLEKAARVNLTHPQAETVFGDEPCLLQSKLPSCEVWSGPSKYKTAQLAYQTSQPDLIIIDDGFSHRKLHRQFDLVLIDATAPLHYFQTLPVGRLRESVSQLNRAHGVLITKTNLVEVGKIQSLINLILTQTQISKENIFKAKSIATFQNLDPNADLVYAFCGLGQPGSFRSSLKMAGFEILQFKEYPDHYAYKSSDLDSILKNYEDLKVVQPQVKLVCTSKDKVKIRNHSILSHIHIFDYNLEFDPSEKVEFIEKVSRHL